MKLPSREGRRLDFLPPFEALKAFFTVEQLNGEPTVKASYNQFTALVRALLQSVEVDEAWYLAQYPGVAEGIRDGVVKSAKDHFIHNGYFEGRLPYPIKVDETWYLEQNPGIAEVIRTGKLQSAQQHFY